MRSLELLYLYELAKMRNEIIEKREQADVAVAKTENVEEVLWEVLKTDELCIEEKNGKGWVELEFDEVKELFVDEYWFSESEFFDLCQYSLEGDISSFLVKLRGIMDDFWVKEDEIMEATREIGFSSDDVFCNYVLVKRQAKMFKYKDVKRVVDKWYAWGYLKDSLHWIKLIWSFDSAIVALRLALQKWVFSKEELVYTTRVSKPTVSALWQALIDAGIAERRW